MTNGLLYTDIFGLEVYSRMQKLSLFALSSFAYINHCKFVTDRCHSMRDAKNCILQ